MMIQSQGLANPPTWGYRAILPFLTVFQLIATADAAESAPPGNPAGESRRGTDAAPSRIIVISGVSDREDAASIERSILAQLADLSVEVEFHNTGADAPTTGELEDLAKTLMGEHSAAAAFIIFKEGSGVVLRTLLHTGDRLESTHRTVDVARGSPLHETLAVIVRAATTALIEREKRPEPADAETPIAPPPEATARSKAPSPRPSNTDRDGKRLYFEIGGAMGIYAKDALSWFGLDLGFGGQPVRHLNLHFGYTALAEVETKAYDVSLRLKRYPFHAGIGYSRSFKRFLWGGGLALDLDYVTEELSSSRETMTPKPAGSELHLGVTVYLFAGIHILESLSFFLNLEAGIPLHSTQYQVETAQGKRRLLLELLPVQPALRTGFRVHFF